MPNVDRWTARTEASRTRAILEYLASQQEPCTADPVALADLADALRWSPATTRDVVERLEAHWLVRVVRPRDGQDLLYITSSGRRHLAP